MSHLLRQWQGASGRAYTHSIHFAGEAIPAVPAVYIFVQRLPDGQRIPLYIGRSGDVRQRVEAHLRKHRQMCEEANELHLHLSAGDQHQRLAIALDLRSQHPTLYNEPPADNPAWLQALLPRRRHGQSSPAGGTRSLGLAAEAA